MCHSITALLPASANLAAVAEIFETHKVGFRQISNPFVREQVTPGDVYVVTTRSRCDCGTPLGSLFQRETNTAGEGERRAAKFRKQGWSEAKIQRWREQKAQDENKKERKQEEDADDATRRVDPWIAFLTALLRSGHTPRIGLLLHWLSGSEENARIRLEGQEYVPLADLNADQLLHIRENVVYHYTL